MKLHLSQGGQQSGPFTEAEVRAQLTSAEFSPTDLARLEGETEWQSVESLLQTLPATEADPPANPPPKKSRLAVASLICGIAGLVTVAPALPAIIIGHQALGRIKTSDGLLRGRGLAIGGLVTGYLILGVVVFSLSFPQYCLITAQANQMKAASNCKQIIGLTLAFAAENCSTYPDSVTSPVTGSVPLTSNDAFRILFQEGLTQDEKIFGCPASRFNPDGNIGPKPAFEQALTAGENHWAMTRGQSNTSTSIMPLIFENPIATTWPPKWNADARGKPVPGRTWSGGKVIIGKNDGSVEAVKLESSSGAAVGPRKLGNGLDMFTEASGNFPQSILNIAIGGTTSYSNDPNILPADPVGLPPAPRGLPPPGGLPSPPALPPTPPTKP